MLRSAAIRWWPSTGQLPTLASVTLIRCGSEKDHLLPDSCTPVDLIVFLSPRLSAPKPKDITATVEYSHQEQIETAMASDLFPGVGSATRTS